MGTVSLIKTWWCFVGKMLHENWLKPLEIRTITKGLRRSSEAWTRNTAEKNAYQREKQHTSTCNLSRCLTTNYELNQNILRILSAYTYQRWNHWNFESVSQLCQVETIWKRDVKPKVTKMLGLFVLCSILVHQRERTSICCHVWSPSNSYSGGSSILCSWRNAIHWQVESKTQSSFQEFQLNQP